MAQYLDEIDKKYWMMVHPYDTIGNVGPSDISVCCPICNEGGSWMRKHRLHLYIKPSYDNAAVKCFNCEYSTNLFGYLKENHPREFSLYANEKRGAGLKTLKTLFKDDAKEDENDDQEKGMDEIPTFDTGLNFDQKPVQTVQKIDTQNHQNTQNTQDNQDGHEEKALSADEIMSFSSGLDFGTPSTPSTPSTPKALDAPMNDGGLFLVPEPAGFTDMPSGPEGPSGYIENRGIEVQSDWRYSPKGNKIKFNGAIQTLSEYIIIPLKKGDLWYGFQALAWKEKRFFVYMVTGNSGHKAWNFYDIDKEKPVYIFESIYDAMSSGLDNVIAQLGANLGDDRIQELKEPIFCLDNQRCDQKAHEETLKYLERGYKCFIWPEGSERFKDTNDLRKLKVPYEKIANMITSNVHQGMMGILKMKMIRV